MVNFFFVDDRTTSSGASGDPNTMEVTPSAPAAAGGFVAMHEEG